jgi:hypothetical protein
MVFDNDATARANVVYAFYDSSQALIAGSMSYGSTYTADSTSWQQLTRTTGAAPAGTAWVYIGTRVYGQPNDSATGGTLYLDDVSATSQ